MTKNSTFYCSGSTHVQGWNKAIYCSNHSGHGQQTLIEAVGHSCNPAFISMGLSVGTETYYKYLKSFGLMDKTGIDMIGEVKGIFQDEKSFNSQVVSLASYSFGQTFNVTPIELIRAQAACVNGGYLYQPYIVEQVLDEDGNVCPSMTPLRCGRSSARRPPPLSGRRWNMWSPPAAAKMAGWRATASAARPAPPIRRHQDQRQPKGRRGGVLHVLRPADDPNTSCSDYGYPSP